CDHNRNSKATVDSLYDRRPPRTDRPGDVDGEGSTLGSGEAAPLSPCRTVPSHRIMIVFVFAMEHRPEACRVRVGARPVRGIAERRGKLTIETGEYIVVVAHDITHRNMRSRSRRDVTTG